MSTYIVFQALGSIMITEGFSMMKHMFVLCGEYIATKPTDTSVCISVLWKYLVFVFPYHSVENSCKATLSISVLFDWNYSQSPS